MKIKNINIEDKSVIIEYKDKDIKVLFNNEELDFEGIENLNEEELNEVSNFVMFSEELSNIFSSEEE